MSKQPQVSFPLGGYVKADVDLVAMVLEAGDKRKLKILVEFLGVPGSGKSTVSHVFADALRDRRLSVAEITYDLDKNHRKVVRMIWKSVYVMSFVLRWPYKTYSYSCCIASTRQSTLFDFAKALFNWLFIAFVTHSDRKSIVTVLDQGVAQALWSVGYAAGRETWIDLLLREPKGAVILPDLVVHVRAGAQSLEERLAARVQRLSRFDGHGGNSASLVRVRSNCDAIVRVLQTKGVRVVEIDNDCPEQLVTGARLIVDALIPMLMNSSRTTDPRIMSDLG